MIERPPSLVNEDLAASALQQDMEVDDRDAAPAGLAEVLGLQHLHPE